MRRRVVAIVLGYIALACSWLSPLARAQQDEFEQDALVRTLLDGSPAERRAVLDRAAAREGLPLAVWLTWGRALTESVPADPFVLCEAIAALEVCPNVDALPVLVDLVRVHVVGERCSPHPDHTADALRLHARLLRGLPRAEADAHLRESVGELGWQRLMALEVEARAGDEVAAIPLLLEALDAPDPFARHAATRAIVRVRGEAIVRPLSAALPTWSADSRGDRARRAMELLGEVGPAAIPALLRQLETDPRGWPDAAHALASIGAPVLTALGARSSHQVRFLRQRLGALSATGQLEALESADPLLRCDAAAVLGQLRDAQAAPALLAALDDADRDVRRAAALALIELGARSASVAPALAERLLTSDDPESRLHAAVALRAIGDAARSEPLVARLTGALNAPDAPVRRLVAHALTAIAPDVPGICGPLAETVDAGDEHEQVRALEDLRALGVAAKPSVSSLVRALGGKWASRASAALEDLGTAGLPALRGLLEDARAPGRVYAAAILARGRDPARPNALLPYLDDPDPHVQHWAAVGVAAALEPPQGAVNGLLRVLKDGARGWMAREAAARALGRWRVEEAAGPLLAILAEEDGGLLGGAAAAALIDLGAQADWIPPLLAAARSGRYHCLLVLEAIGPAAAAALRSIAEDPASEAGRASVALGALVVVARAEGHAALRARLAHPEPGVRYGATSAVLALQQRNVSLPADVLVAAALAHAPNNVDLRPALEQAIPLLERVAAGPAPDQLAAMSILAQLDDPRAARALLRSGDESTRARVISRVRDPQALLDGLASARTAELRAAIAQALGSCPGDVRARRTLDALARSDPSHHVRARAVQALGWHAAAGRAALLAAIRDRAVRPESSDVVSALAAKDVWPRDVVEPTREAIALMRDGDPELRRLGVAVLAAIAEQTWWHALLRPAVAMALDDPDPVVRERASRALDRLKSLQ